MYNRRGMINRTVLMSGADWFDDGQAINAFMDSSVKVDRQKAQAEHDAIREALQSAGVKVVQVKPPENCQDGVYTANWALVRGNKAVMSRLPNARTGEEPYAAQILRDLGKEIYTIPDGLKFSGQGDALPCGNLLLAGSGYRSDPTAQRFVAEALGYQLVQLQTVPQKNWFGRPVINKASGWPDSFFYDIDLALSILRFPEGEQKGLISWCPEAFMPESQRTLRALDALDKIEISLHEAKDAFACNLVSTGKTVVMGAHAPNFTAELRARGFNVLTPEISELLKGGGYIRCTTLTLDND
jgi:N-dimethylarginine dimethylaminohydrolase